MNNVVLLVTGDRNWSNGARIYRTIAAAAPFLSRVIHGGARGADTLAGDVAVKLGIPVTRYPAQWDRWGRSAGMIRNQQMLTVGRPNLVFAFHNDIRKSRGTADMIGRAGKERLMVVLFTAETGEVVGFAQEISPAHLIGGLHK